MNVPIDLTSGRQPSAGKGDGRVLRSRSNEDSVIFGDYDVKKTRHFERNPFTSRVARQFCRTEFRVVRDKAGLGPT